MGQQSNTCFHKWSKLVFGNCVKLVFACRYIMLCLVVTTKCTDTQKLVFACTRYFYLHIGTCKNMLSAKTCQNIYVQSHSTFIFTLTLAKTCFCMQHAGPLPSPPPQPPSFGLLSGSATLARCTPYSRSLNRHVVYCIHQNLLLLSP